METATADLSLTEQLLEILRQPIDAETRARAGLHLVDWVGCALIGKDSDVAAAFSRELQPHSIAGLLSQNNDPARLAMALGGLGSILEMDDVHRTAILHPGPVIIPASLAAANDEASGEDFLDAVIRGYDAMIRLGIAVGTGHYAFFHNTATCGGFGSAFAAGELLGLNDRQKIWAVGNAMSIAGGLWQCRNEPVMTKPFHCAEAARRGLQSARLAQAGLTGPRYILEGPQGFFAATCPGSEPQILVASPDAPWAIWDTSFKPWPACRHAHATIDAALALRNRIDDPKAIKSIEIETYADAVTFCDKPDPKTETEAKFSLQHSAAVVFSDGLPTLPAFKPDVLSSPDYVHYRRLATVRSDPGLSAAYPSHFGSRMTVILADGSRLTELVPDALGDKENPLSEDAIMAKSVDLMDAAGVPADLAGRLIEQAMALSSGTTLATFRASLADAFHATA